MRLTSGEPSTPGSRMPAGRVGRAHGLDGSFYVTGARPRLLALGAIVTVGGRERTVVRRAGTDDHPIVRLAGIEDRAVAESVRGQELLVDREHAPSLEEGEWWAGDLVGCEVTDGERLVGIVRSLIELPSCEALEVDRAGRLDRRDDMREREREGSLLVPMVRNAIRSIDVSARRIDVDMSFLGEGA